MTLSLRICSVVLLAMAAEAFLFDAAGRGKGSGSYNGYSAPKYKVLEKTLSYELREYEATNWVATSAVGSANSMFMRLFRYIGGGNDAQSKIAMTVPVAIKIVPDTKEYTMMFFLTTADNPKPESKDVFLTSLPSFKAYVRTYGGYTNEQKLQSNLDALKKEVGANADLSSYYSSGYDSPWKFWARRNEVWVMKN